MILFGNSLPIFVHVRRVSFELRIFE